MIDCIKTYYKHADLHLLYGQISSVVEAGDLIRLLKLEFEQTLNLLVPKYRSFHIIKKGVERVITQPAEPLYVAQVRLNQYLNAAYLVKHFMPNDLPVHSYIPRIIGDSYDEVIVNRNNKTNAEAHLGCSRLLKLDIESFFRSITRSRVRYAIAELLPNASEDCIDWIVHLTTTDDSLPAGAPCSPTVSNILLWRFDILAKSMEKTCYTRYGDDITFSTRDLGYSLDELQSKVKSELGLYGLHLKKSKCESTRVGNRFMVTGVVINEKPSVPRSYIKWLRAVIHDCEQRGLDASAIRYITVNKKKYKRYLIRKYRSFKIYAKDIVIDEFNDPRYYWRFFINSVMGHIGYIRHIRGLDDPISTNLRERFQRSASGSIEKQDPRSFTPFDSLAYITNATSNSVVYYAYAFLRHSQFSDPEIRQLRDLFSSESKRIDYEMLKDNFINQSAYFIRLYDYMTNLGRFVSFYNGMEEHQRNSVFRFGFEGSGPSPYMRFVYHNDMNCELIKKDYDEEDGHHKNTGVFYGTALKFEYKGYMVSRKLLNQFGMRPCMNCSK
jgi:hypothetical protein